MIFDNPSEFLKGLIVFGVYPPKGGSGGGTVTNVGTGTGLTGGPITTTGVISLATISDSNLLANISGSTAAPTPHTLTSIFDHVFSNTQGDILYRNGTVWTFLPPGTAGQVLMTGGSGANPSWAGGTGGTVTNIATGTGLTGGPLTSTGTIAFSTIGTGLILSNISGSTAAPTPHTLTAILDNVIDNTQGDILYRNGTVWTFLPPGTSGQVLTTGGASANPSWTSTGGGSVTSVATGTGLTGGTITTSGTVSLASVPTKNLLANLTGSSAAPLPHVLSDILDSVFTNIQGSILYRANADWSYLIPSSPGYLLQTGGPSEDPSWVPPPNTSFTWHSVATSIRALVEDNGYVTNNGSTLVTYTLPTSAGFGSIIKVSGFSSGGWAIHQNDSQSIMFGDVTTTAGTGGSLASTNQGDQVELLCVVADTTWVVLNSIGNITYV